MSRIHFMFALIFGMFVAYHPVVGDYCALSFDTGIWKPKFEFIPGSSPPANRKCTRLCQEHPDAGQSISCAWDDGGTQRTCTMQVTPDGESFHFTEGSVCPDLNGMPVNIYKLTTTTTTVKPPKPEPNKNEDQTDGVGSANASVIFLLLITGGSLALIWMVLADGGRFGGGGGIH